MTGSSIRCCGVMGDGAAMGDPGSSEIIVGISKFELSGDPCAPGRAELPPIVGKCVSCSILSLEMGAFVDETSLIS